MKKLVPDNFTVPERFTGHGFVARKLMVLDLELDYAAVISSVDLIRKMRGGDWPTTRLTLEQDLKDLGWHEKEFENKSSFTYTVMNPEETMCWGCFYLYPPGLRGDIPNGADVDWSFWVTEDAYSQGLYEQLYSDISVWLVQKWPFKKPYCSNVLIPERN
jgi:hypothetical protein